MIWKRALWGILIALLVLPPLVYRGGLWWVQAHYLNQDRVIGEGVLRFHGAHLSWLGRLELDSVEYLSPELKVRVEGLYFEVSAIPSFIPLRPRLLLTLGQVKVALSPNPNKPKKPLPDSLAFPEILIPVEARVQIKLLGVENDAGILVQAQGLTLVNPNSKKIHLQINELISPHAAEITAKVEFAADWKKPDSLSAELNLTRASDQVFVAVRQSKKNMLHGWQSLKADIPSLDPYFAALKSKANTPKVEGLQIEAHSELGDSLSLQTARLRLTGEVKGFSDSMPLKLSAQQMALTFDWHSRTGAFQFESQGKKGEDVLLQGDLKAHDPLQGDTGAPLWHHYDASLHGHLRHFQVHTGNREVEAAAEIENLDWRHKILTARVRTRDGSQVEATLRQTASNWRGNFKAQIASQERWIVAFTDTNLNFSSLQMEGTLAGKSLQATLAAGKVKAYGVMADTLIAVLEGDAKGYRLLPSHLTYSGKTWKLTGAFTPATPKATYWGKIENTRYGSIYVTQTREGELQAELKDFSPLELPYQGLERIPIKQPLLRGTFAWDRQRRKGAVKLAAQGLFKDHWVQTEVKGDWDAQALRVERIFLAHQKSKLILKTRILLHGKQFWDLAHTQVADVPLASMQADHFDLAEVLGMVLESPPLASGLMQGQLGFDAALGFQGELTFDKVVQQGSNAEDTSVFTLKRLSLAGSGDSLIVLANTVSGNNPILNNFLRLTVASVLGENQQVRAEIVSAQSLKLLVEATSHRFQDLQGQLTLTGRLPFEGQIGSLEDLQVKMNFAVPFRTALAEARVTTENFQGRYVMPGWGEQIFSMKPEFNSGRLTLGDLQIKNKKGETLQGHLDLSLLGDKVLRASLKGESFALRLKEDQSFELKGIQINLVKDSLALQVSGAVQQIQFEYAASPLRSQGTLVNTQCTYTLPHENKSKAKSEGVQSVTSEIPSLSLNTSLRDTEIRYRLKSVQAIQDLFKKSPTKKRKVARARPLQLDISVKSLGDSNRVDTDILRLRWVGDLEMHGVQPYALMNGRINSLRGELGLENQSYALQQMTLKWLNAPVAEGEIFLEAKKRLASDCKKAAETSGVTDSCVVITRLTGLLPEMHFEYDTDCGGSFGAGGSVAAMLFSVRRGCYDPALFAGGSGASYGEQAISLLEPSINNKLSSVMRRFTGKWIAATEVSGLGSLASGAKDTALQKNQGTSQQAVSVQLVSREYKRLRLKLKSGYHSASQDLSNPWEHRMAIEWRPPVERVVEEGVLRDRLQDHVRVVASVESKPVARNAVIEEPIEKKLGLNYTYDFWGGWKKKNAKGTGDSSLSQKPSSPYGKAAP